MVDVIPEKEVHEQKSVIDNVECTQTKLYTIYANAFAHWDFSFHALLEADRLNSSFDLFLRHLHLSSQVPNPDPSSY